MVVWFYKEDNLSLLHTKIKALGLMISAKTAFVCFPIVSCRIWPEFELIRDIMVVLVTATNEEDPIKNEGAGVATTLN